MYSRFHFRPHFYQHASFRVVETEGEMERGFLTSDTDAPGPYVSSAMPYCILFRIDERMNDVQVGKYPFRRSQEALMKQMKEAKGDDRQAHLDEQLNKHFGSSSLLSALAHSFPTISSAVLAKVAALNMNLKSAKLLEVGCGPGGNALTFAGHFPFGE